MSDHDYEPNEGQGDNDQDDIEAGAEVAKAASAPKGSGDEGEDVAAAEIAALNDKLLRLAAELENTRRRADRERIDAGRYAIANFARDLLSVADNFERALAYAPSENEMESAAVAGLVSGVRMTEKELVKTLERHGVMKIDPVGEKFDPNIHQAVAQAPAAGVPAGHVAQTAQTGFVLGDRILRAAMVIVSTGEPPAGKNEPAEPSEPGAHIDTEA